MKIPASVRQVPYFHVPFTTSEMDEVNDFKSVTPGWVYVVTGGQLPPNLGLVPTNVT